VTPLVAALDHQDFAIHHEDAAFLEEREGPSRVTDHHAHHRVVHAVRDRQRVNIDFLPGKFVADLGKVPACWPKKEKVDERFP
jgi:hypothetical protein